MKVRLLLVITLAIVLALPVGVQAQGGAGPEVTASSLPEVVTVVGSTIVNSGSFRSKRVLCPEGMVAVGGGVDLYNTNTMKVTSSAPTFAGDDARLINRPDGSNPAPIGWQASARNDDARNLEFKVAVICAPMSGVRTVVGSSTVNSGSFRSERVLCPSRTVALGGGIDLYNVNTMRVTSSAPVFAQDPERLIARPDGINPAPNGWQASTRNDDTRNLLFKVGVICAPQSGIQTVVGSDTANSGSFASERVLCPRGKIAVGGGIDLYNVNTMVVTSSAPTFNQNNNRLIFQPDGINPAPIGWQGSSRNYDARNLEFKVGVICGQPAYRAFLPVVIKRFQRRGFVAPQ